MEKVKNLLLIRGYGPIHEDRFQFHEERYAKTQGIHVVHPQDVPDFVPVPGGPRPEARAVEEFIVHTIEREGLEPDRTKVLAHSLGGNAWLRVLKTRKALRACSTWLIGTPRENRDRLPEIDDFFPTPDLEDFEDEERGRILVVGSDNDAVIGELPHTLGAHLGVPSLTIPKAGHFMPRALHGRPHVMDLGPEWLRVRNQIRNLNLPY